MLLHQGRMKSFHTVFNIYWLYQGILNFVHREFMNKLKISHKTLFVIQQLQNVSTD